MFAASLKKMNIPNAAPPPLPPALPEPLVPPPPPPPPEGPKTAGLQSPRSTSRSTSTSAPSSACTAGRSRIANVSTPCYPIVQGQRSVNSCRSRTAVLNPGGLTGHRAHRFRHLAKRKGTLHQLKPSVSTPPSPGAPPPPPGPPDRPAPFKLLNMGSVESPPFPPNGAPSCAPWKERDARIDARIEAPGTIAGVGSINSRYANRPRTPSTAEEDVVHHL